MTYIIQSTNFTQEFIDEEIFTSLDYLYFNRKELYQHWFDYLYDEDKNKLEAHWNEYTLMQMYDDVESCNVRI